MQRRFFLAFLLLETIAVSQPNPPGPNQTASQRAATASPKSNAAKPKYLTAPLDITLTNLGENFAGHDIATLYKAVEDSPALQEKSEFESTAAFEMRRAAFVDRPFYGSIMPTEHLGFVIEGDAFLVPQFGYDADAQAMGVKLLGETTQFIMDKGEPRADTILIRRVDRGRDRYIGTNAFGASVKVDRTYSQEFRVSFDPDSWVFRSSGPVPRHFQYSVAMGAQQARAIRADIKLLFVCRLTEPWRHHTVTGHEPTFDTPVDTVLTKNCLHVFPEQLWILNSRTGEVVRKISEIYYHCRSTRRLLSIVTDNNYPAMAEFNWHTNQKGNTDELEVADFYYTGSSAGWGEQGKPRQVHETDKLVIRFKDRHACQPIMGEDARKVLAELQSVDFRNIRYHPAVG